MANKDTGIRVRVEKHLRDQFIEVCKSQDKPAAQVIREYMRDHIDRHQQLAQVTLFDDLDEGGA